MLKTKYLVIGAGFLGLGFAFSHKNSIILEQTEILGGEFTNALRPFGKIEYPQFDTARDFYAFSKENGIIAGDYCDNLKIMSVLCSYAEKNLKDRIFLDAMFLYAQKCDSGYIVSYRTNEGIKHIECEKIIDTTDRVVSCRALSEISEKRLSLFAASTDKDIAEKLASSDFSYLKLGFKPQMISEEKTEEYILTMAFDGKESIITARKKITEAFRRTFDAKTKINFIAFDFDYICKADIPHYFDPHKALNPFEALDMGCGINPDNITCDNVYKPQFDVLGEDAFFYSLIDGKSVCEKVAMPVFAKSFDLAVAGLGSAGSFCALSAAREGIKVLGIERGNCVGGMSVAGSVVGYYNGYCGGTFEDVDNEIKPLINTVFSKYTNHPDAKKQALEQRIKNNGGEILFSSVILGVYTKCNEKTVVGVRIASEGEMFDIAVKQISDSTSDGHILRILGVEYDLGREKDGETQPFSSVKIVRKPNGNLARTNFDSGTVNQYNDTEFSNSVISADGRHTDSGNPQNERFLHIAPQIGLREGLMLRAGEEKITLNDIIFEKRWEKPIICAYSDIDKHGENRAFEDRLYVDWFVVANCSTVTMKIEIPIGSLVPKGINGIFVASRSICADNYASAAIRMNRDMYRLGEIAGIAAAICVKGGYDKISDIPYSLLREKTEYYNCFDPKPDVWHEFVDKAKDKNGKTVWVCRPFEWISDINEIKSELSSRTPAVAIWSVKRMFLGGNTDIADTLFDFMKSDNEDLARNSAIALGIIDDERCLPKIREMIKSRDARWFIDNRRSNQLRGIIAVLLAGRFGDTDSFDIISEILKPDEFENSIYHTYLKRCYKFNISSKINTVYYLFLSYAMVSLMEIKNKNPQFCEKYRDIMKNFASSDCYRKNLSNGKDIPPLSAQGKMIEELYRFCEKG